MKNFVSVLLVTASLISSGLVRAENVPDVQKKIQGHEQLVKYYQSLVADAKGRRKGELIEPLRDKTIPDLEKKIAESKKTWDAAMVKAREALLNSQIDPSNATFYAERNRTSNAAQKARLAIEDLQDDLDDAQDKLGDARKAYGKFDLKKLEYELEVKQHQEAIALLKSGKSSADRTKEIQDKANADLKVKEDEKNSLTQLGVTKDEEIKAVKKKIASLQSQLKKSKSDLGVCQGGAQNHQAADLKSKILEDKKTAEVGTGAGTGTSNNAGAIPVKKE